MGRGRQKAKDAKIARELKYTNHGGDLRALERELVAGERRATTVDTADAGPTADDSDPYDRWADDDD